MLINRLLNSLRRPVIFLVVLAVGATTVPLNAMALQEQAMTQPDLVSSQATIMNSQWIEVYLRENEYNSSNVSNTAYYSISSSTDPDFSSAIHPAAVQNRYYPEDAPYLSTTDTPRLNMIYRIYLQMPSGTNLKEGHSYNVTVSPAVVNVPGMSADFDLSEPNPVIHVNQVGYGDGSPKVAYMSWWTGQGSISFNDAIPFQIINEQNGSSVYSGDIALKKTAAQEKWSKSDVYEMDFSDFQQEGTFHLYIPGVGVSFPFEISSTIYSDNIGYTLIRGLTMQRDGDHGLDDPAVTHWTRPAAHLDDAVDQATGQRVDLVGGHMDAGDRGKYPINVATTSSTLLAAAQLFPDQIETLGESLEIPESDNGAPDFLDELVYELDYLRKAVMNTSKEGALPRFLRPAGGGYEQGFAPEGATGRVFFSATEGPLKAETLYAAGALAMAYNTPLLHEYYPAAKLEGYKQAALKAFGAFENHANDNAFWNSNLGYDVYTAGIHTWSDEMLFAASNLHKITGESKYLAWINSELPANLGAEQKRWSWDNQGPWLVAFLGLYNDSNLSGAVRQNAYNAILEWADTIMSANNQAPYGVPMVDSTYTSVGWYFSGSQIAFPMSVAYGVSRLQKYKNQIATTWNYLLGSNPLSESFISGMGDPEHRPRWLVHEISQYNYAQYSLGNGGWSEMIPGIPNSDLQQGNFPAYFANDPWNNARREKWFPALGSYPALYRYSDSWNVQNEFVIANVAHNAASIIPLIAVDGGDPGDTTPPAVPTGLTADAGDSQITLSWNASSESDLEGYNVYVNGVKKNTSPLTATGYTAAGLANGTTYALTITAVDQSGNESAHSAAVQAAPEADIGSTVSSKDIGTAAAVPGTTFVNSGEYTVTGGGESFATIPDGLRYVYRSDLTGAFSISAKLESVNADNPAKGMAGVMIRQGTGVDDVYAALFVRNGQLIAQYRKGGPWSEEVLNKAVTGPIWLKVERQSALNLIRTYTSSDGINWTLNVTTKSGETQDTTANFWAWHEAGTELNAGVFVSAAEAGKSVSAVFSNIKDTASWPNTP